MSDRHARPVLVSAIGDSSRRQCDSARCRAAARRTASSTSRSATMCSFKFSAWLAQYEPVERHLCADPRARTDDPDRLVDHCAIAQRALQLVRPLLRMVEQLRVVHRHRRGPCELRAQLHGMLTEGVPGPGIRVDRADQLVADQHRQRQRGVHAHPGHPTLRSACHRRSLPSEPLTVARRDCIHVMQGPSWMSMYCNLSMCSTNSAVTAHALTVGVSPDVSIIVTPAPSTPGIARAANSATSPRRSVTPRAPATRPATPRRPAYRSTSSASRCAADTSGGGSECRPGWAS